MEKFGVTSTVKIKLIQ